MSVEVVRNPVRPLIRTLERDVSLSCPDQSLAEDALCRVCGEAVARDSDYCSGTCRQVEKDTWWALVKDKPSRDTRPYRWAKTHLGLIESGEDVPPAQPRTAGHICGWMQLDGVWQCVQDFYAVSWAPQTSCGAVWHE